MDHVSTLLQGAIDLHIHSAPSIVKRSVDSWDALVQADAAGMRGILIKDHQFPTATQTWVINRHADTPRCRLYGSLCLNNAVGGLNPFAVEAAVKMGVDLVYLPTFSAANHLAFRNKLPTANNPAPAGDKRVLPLVEEPISLLDVGGNLKPVVKTIIDMVADAGIILGTGHSSKEETYEAVRYAVETGCEKICLTHFPAYTTNDMDELKKITDLGDCYVELCYEMVVRNMPSRFRYSHGQLAALIRFFGVERMVMSTDFGQAHNPEPVEGMKTVIRMLIDEGFDDREIRTMISHNPAKLLGLD